MDTLRNNANTKTYFETNLDDAKPAPYCAHLFPEAANAKEGGSFHYQGLDVPFFVSRAENERAVFVAATGLNSYTSLRQDELEQLNKAGVSVVWMALPPHKSGVPFMGKFISAVEGFFTNEESPAFKMFDRDLPRVAVTHSTSGQIMTALEQNPETNRKLMATYRQALHIAPYFDATNVSMNHSWAPVRWAFHAHALLFKDRKPHESPLGRLYMEVAAGNEPFSKTGQVTSPTYAQILEVQHYGRGLVSSFRNAAEDRDTTMPSTYLVGRNDPFASALTSIDMARKTDSALVIVPKGGHYPINAEILKQYLERIGVTEPAVEPLRDSPRLAA